MKAILEKIPHWRERSFHLFEIRGQRIGCPFHYHPEIELTMIVGSSGHRYVGDHVGRFAAGDLVLLGPNLPHMYVNDATFSGTPHTRVIQFFPDFLGTDFLERAEMKRIRQLIGRSRAGMVFHGRTRERVGVRLGQLFKLDDFARLVAFLEVLEMLARSREWRPLASAAYSPSLALYQGERINRVCELISKKFRDGITQSEAARAARMSVPSFSRFFRRATNKTFRAFLNEVRVGHASQMLLETDLSVAEICYASGFGNLSNFNRQFLNLRKIPPRRYRTAVTQATGETAVILYDGSPKLR